MAAQTERPPESGIRVTSADDMETANDALAESQPEMAPGSPATYAQPAEDDRWRDIMAGFVDDPRGAVQAATDRVEDEVSALMALLSEHRERLLAATSGDAEAHTEEMRKALLAYRDFSGEIAKNVRSLS